MTRTVDAAQMVDSANIKALTIIKLVTFSDKALGNVQSTHYIAKQAVEYDYANGGTDQFFKPWLRTISALRTSTVHVADGRGSGVTIEAIDVTLHNGPYAGDRISNLLTADNLEGATIEIAQLVSRGESSRYIIDKTAFTGDEHNVWFRGKVSRRTIRHEQVVLHCETELPSYAWPQVLDETEAAPRDIGTRFPMPYGSNAIVRCPSWSIGWVTKTTTPISSLTTLANIGVADASGFPAGAFTIRIGAELIRISGKSGNTLTPATRGYDGSTATTHPTGMPISELQSALKYIVSAAPISSLNRLLVQSPTDGTLIEAPVDFSFNREDTAVISGESVSSIEFTSAQLLALALFLDSQQPTDSEGGETPTTVSSISASSFSSNTRDGNTSTYQTLTATSSGQVTKKAIFAELPAGTTRQTIRVHIDPTNNETDFVNMKVRRSGWGGELMLKVLNGDGGKAWYEFDTTAEDITWYFIFNFIGIGDVRIYEIERVSYAESSSIVTFAAHAENQLAQFGLDLQLFADVDGIQGVIPWVEAYDFDDSDSWSALNATSARDTSTQHEGAAARKMLADQFSESETLVDGMEDFTNWADTNATRSDESGGGLTTEGTNSMKAFNTAAGDFTVKNDTGNTYNLDLTNGGGNRLLILIDLRMNFGWSNTGEKINVRIAGTDGELSTAYHRFEFDIDSLVVSDTWYTLFLDYLNPTFTQGSPGDTDIDHIQIEIPSPTGTTTVYIDNIRTVVATGADQEAVIQNNSLSDLDMDADALYAMWVKFDSTSWFNPSALTVTVELTDDVVTGTTQAANRRSIEFALEGVEDAWYRLQANSFADTLSPDITACKTLRIVLTYPEVTSGIFAQSVDDTIISFDLLDMVSDAGNVYEASYNAPLEKPVDVVRHWVATIGGGTVNDSALTAANTNLGTNILSGDARGWAVDWAGVLAQIAYISRSNIFPRHTATGVEWAMLCAESDYAWPAASKTITLFEPEDVTDIGRDHSRELASGRTFLYAFDPNMPGTDGYTKLIRIGEDQNDASAKVAAGIISAAVSNFGSVEALPEFLLGIRDDDTAIEIAGYRYTELARLTGSIFLIENLGWSDSYDVELGDLLSFEAPWDSGTTIKGRVIEYEKVWETERATLRLVEVL